MKSIFTTFILPRLLLGKRKNKWQFFVTFLEKGRWKAANFELTEKADSDYKLFFCGEKEILESEFVLLRAHAAAVFSDVYFFENSFKEQPPSTQRPNKQTIILRNCVQPTRVQSLTNQRWELIGQLCPWSVHQIISELYNSTGNFITLAGFRSDQWNLRILIGIGHVQSEIRPQRPLWQS